MDLSGLAPSPMRASYLVPLDHVEWSSNREEDDEEEATVHVDDVSTISQNSLTSDVAQPSRYVP